MITCFNIIIIRVIAIGECKYEWNYTVDIYKLVEIPKTIFYHHFTKDSTTLIQIYTKLPTQHQSTDFLCPNYKI